MSELLTYEELVQQLEESQFTIRLIKRFFARYVYLTDLMENYCDLEYEQKVDYRQELSDMETLVKKL